QRLKKHVFGNKRHAHSVHRTVKSRVVFMRSENIDVTIMHPECFHAFKNRLAVVKREHRGAYRNVRERYDCRLLPFAVLEVGDDHMVCYVFTKLKIVKVCLLNSRFCRALYRDASS